MNVPTLPTFTGLIPPRPEPLTHPYSQYKCFFLDENMFDQYLAITPFNRVHADVLCACAIRPHGFLWKTTPGSSKPKKWR